MTAETVFYAALNAVVDFVSAYSGEVIAGLVGGAVVAVLTATFRYLYGWYRAGQYRGTEFHIAATLYTPLDASNPGHAPYLQEMSAGKTHVQELLWLGEERPLEGFLTNAYVFYQVNRAMDRARGAGVLLGRMPQSAERPLMNKIVGHHNAIPSTDLVRLFKSCVGTGPDGRVFGISPPTHESYGGSPHRRVMRAMFVAESQLRDGLPPEPAVVFPQNGHANRYATLTAIIEDYRANPDRYQSARVFF